MNDETPTLHYVTHDGDGPVCLLVHGMLASRSYWAGNIDALRTIVRPVVVELWGHGRSPSPADPAMYTADAYVQQFDRILDDLGVNKVVTIGQSMGAALTLHYGLARPERVHAQIITNSSSAFSSAQTWEKTLERYAYRWAPRILEEGVETLADSWVNPATSRRIPESIREPMWKEFAEHTALGVANSMLHTNPTLPVRSQLEDVTQPTLLTLGVKEEGFLPLVPVVRRIPSLDVVELDAAHPVNAQVPDAWNAAVVEWLSARLDR